MHTTDCKSRVVSFWHSRFYRTEEKGPWQANNCREWTTVVVGLSLLLCLSVPGCGGQAGATAGNATAWIKADPNPVPVPGGATQGTTTVSWDTGGPQAEVYLRVAEKADQLFSGGPRNKQDAKWIRKGREYEFVLFAGKEHQTELAKVTVTGE